MEEPQKLGVVYQIKSDKGPESYIGSSVLSINDRMAHHRAGYKRWAEQGKGNHCRSYTLFAMYGMDSCSAHVLQVVPYHHRSEIREIENRWIENTPGVLNANRALITKEQHLASMKAWREKNKTYNQNYMNQRIQCDCGMEIGYTTKWYHKKSGAHDRAMKAKDAVKEAVDKVAGDVDENKEEAKAEPSPSTKLTKNVVKPVHIKCGCGITIKRKEFSSHRKTTVHVIWVQAEKSREMATAKAQQ